MKQVAIFEDGKISRGVKATLIKRGNKRVLIEYEYYDDYLKKNVVRQHWFKLYIPKWTSNKKQYKHNNKRNIASYIHENPHTLNCMFYSDYRQSYEFKVLLIENSGVDFYRSLYESE